MRRFLCALAVAGTLMPLRAFAHGGDEGSRGSADTSTPSAISPAPEDWFPTRFHGSSLTLDQSTTPETLCPSCQLSPIPSYQWWISFRPRFYFTPDLSLRARSDVTIEWTQGGADTTQLYQPIFGDIWADLVYSPSWAKLVAGPLSVSPSIGLRTLFPVSLQSQANGNYITVGGTVGANAVLQMPAHSELSVSLSFALTHDFTSSTTPGIMGAGIACEALDESTPAVCGAVTGATSAWLKFSTAIIATYTTPLRPLSITAFYLVGDSWAYTPAAASIMDQTGGTTVVPQSPNDTNFRQLEWFLASVDYAVTPWMAMSAGFYTLRNVLDPNSTYGDPLYMQGGATRIFFDATITFDALYQALTNTTPPPEPSTNGAPPPPSRRQASITDIARQLREQRLMSGMY